MEAIQYVAAHTRPDVAARVGPGILGNRVISWRLTLQVKARSIALLAASQDETFGVLSGYPDVPDIS